jgi:TPR repeat protein
MHDKLFLLFTSKLMTEETTKQNINDEININDVDASFSSGIAAFEAKNFKQSLQFLAPLAEAGDAESQHRCAIMYQNGLGVVANEAKAAEFMQAAAEQGHAIAQHGLGFMYMEGECVEKNPQLAVKWFTKAGEQGLVGSLTTLAMMYQEGNGVEKNPEEAKRLYKLAGFDDMQVE